MTTEIVAYTPTKAALAGLSAKYKNVVYDVTTSKGMAEAKAAKKEIAAHRIALEKARVKEKADSLAYSKRVDNEARPLAEQIAELEDPIDAQINAEENRLEAARQAAIKAEEERIAAEERAKKEAEEKRLADERAKLAAERAEFERQQAAQRAIDEKARQERAEADRQARAKIEEEERAARKRIADAEQEARAKRQAEEDRLKAERDKLDSERREAEDMERRAREMKEIAAAVERRAAEERQREAERIANELVDARTMLETFRKRFGHRPEFVLVLEAIDECLEVA